MKSHGQQPRNRRRVQRMAAYELLEMRRLLAGDPLVAMTATIVPRDDSYQLWDGEASIVTGITRYSDVAPVVLEVEPNNDFDQPQVLRWHQFGKGFDVDIQDSANINISTIIPHVTILGTGDGTFDYYQFTVAQRSRAVFDIDSASNGLDGWVTLYDSLGQELAAQDDFLGAELDNLQGSLDPLLEYEISTPGTYTLRVGSCCIAPVPNGQTYRLHLSLESGNAGLLANDLFLTDETPQVELVEAPTLGELAFQPDGNFVYTPPPGWFGRATFTYREQGGEANRPQGTVTIDVIDVNQAPRARTDAYALQEDNVLVVSAEQGVLANDQDGDEDGLVAVIERPPTYGELTLQADGSFRYTPFADFNGFDSFEYVAFDGSIASPSTVVTLQIEAVVDLPIANNDRYEMVAGTVLDASSDSHRRMIRFESANRLVDTRLDGSDVRVLTTGLATPTQVVWDAGSQTVYFADDATQSLRSIRYDGTQQRTIYRSDSRIRGLALGMHQGEPALFWSDVEQQAIYRADLRGENVQRIYQASFPYRWEVTLESLQFDPQTQQLYWIDQDVRAIYRAWTDGSHVERVVDAVELPSDLAFEPHRRELYFLEGDAIYRLNIAQRRKEQVVTQLTNPHDLLVESQAGKLYWFEGPATLRRSNLDGTDVETVQTRARAIHAMAVIPAPERGVFANDRVVDVQRVELIVEQLPLAGRLDWTPSGRFLYTPPDHFVGTDTFRYFIQAGDQVSDVATVTVEVIAGPPRTQSDSYSVLEDQVLQVAAAVGVLQNDVDHAGTPFVAQIVTWPQHGRLTLQSDGRFEYTPNLDFAGNDGFTYTARSIHGDSPPTSVTIQVQGTPDAVRVVDDHYVVASGTVLDTGSDFVRSLYVTNRSLQRLLTVPLDGTTPQRLDPVNYAALTDVDVDAEGDVWWNDLTGVVRFDPQRQESVRALTLHSPLALVVTSDQLYAVESNPRAIVTAAGSLPRVVTDVADSTAALDWDPQEDRLYWPSGTTIVRSRRDGSDQQVILRGLRAPGAMAINVAGRTMYWFDRLDRVVYRANLDGSNVEAIIAGITLISDIEVDGLAERLYLADSSGDRVLRTDLAGGQLKVVAANIDAVGVGLRKTTVGDLFANDVDPDDNRAALQVDVVHSTTHGTLQMGRDGRFAYTPQAGFVGSDQFTYQVTRQGITSPLATVTIDVEASEPLAEPDQLSAVEDVVARWSTLMLLSNDRDPLGQPWQGVEIVAQPTHGTLAASEGELVFTPQPDYAGPDRFVYRAVANDGRRSSPANVVVHVVGRPDAPEGGADRVTVRQDSPFQSAAANLMWSDTRDDRISSSDPQGTSRSVVAQFPALSQVRDLEQDHATGAIYALDRGLRTIVRQGAEGEPLVPVVTQLHAPTGLAVDAEQGFLYWGEESLGVIERSRLDGTERTVVVSHAGQPTAIAVHNQVVYWADKATGTIRSTATPNMPLRRGLSLPIDIIVDQRGQYLYYSDTGLGLVGRVDLASGVAETVIDRLTGPRGLALDELTGNLYWADSTAGAIHRVPVAGGDSTRVVEGLSVPWGVLFRPSESLLVNDRSPDESPLSASVVTWPQFGSLTLAPNGDFVYIPHVGFVGSDVFYYQPQGEIAGAPTRVDVTVVAHADFDGDGMVDAADFGWLIEHWESLVRSTTRHFDLTGDGRIDAADADRLFAQWRSGA